MPCCRFWERQSVPLKVSDEYKKSFSEFKQYFDSEKSAIGDPTLDKEDTVLTKLIDYNSVPENPNIRY